MIALNAEVSQGKFMFETMLSLLSSLDILSHFVRYVGNKGKYCLRLQVVLLSHSRATRWALLPKRRNGNEEAGVAEPFGAFWA
jgi:hypothetical protein